MTVLGTRPLRQDGREKVTGQARYTADLTLTGMATGRFLFAGRSAGRIVRIDCTEARALRGVLAVVTHEDVPAVRYGHFVRDRVLFATDVVRYEGDVVAGVAAVSDDIALKALDLIRVEYESLEPVLNPHEALSEGSRLVHVDWASYDAGDIVRDGNDCSRSTAVKGNIDQGLGEADLIVEEQYETDMSHPVPIEPHAVTAQWQGDKVTIWSTSQVPFDARSGVALTLGVPENHVRIIVPHLGGGFGGKSDFHYEAHVAVLARKARRPVRVVFTRREEFIAPDCTRHAVSIRVATGIRRDGTMTGRRARIVLDGGAYAADSPILTEVATMMAAGPYRIPHLDIEARAVYTNRTPGGSVRAPTGPQICWAVEQHTDVLAARLGMDPFEFRMRNLVEEGDEGPTRQIFEAIGVKQALQRAAELVGWGDNLSPDEGIGFSCGWWLSLPLPSGAYVKLNADGSGTITTGAQENGSGAVMGLPILAAETLGMRPEDFTVLAQDTDAGPWDMGSCGSQTTFNNGRAVVAAALEVSEQLRELAANELEAASSDIELVDGMAKVVGTSLGISVSELAAKSHDGGSLLLGRGSGDPPATPDHDASGCIGRSALGAFAAPSFFAHAARVRVDQDTGVVTVVTVGAVHDFGRVLNPTGVEGQVEGGVVNGIGIALTEGTQHDGDGLQTNPYLLNYKLPTAADAPDIRIDFVEALATAGGPFGAKGVGEPPVIGTAGAVANAIARVIGSRVYQLPMTPERVWSAALNAEQPEVS